MKVSENIIIKKPLDYLTFLNASTKFDILLVNDVSTIGNWEKNPYLPSKLSDYLGASCDIWAITEKGSVLDSLKSLNTNLISMISLLRRVVVADS